MNRTNLKIYFINSFFFLIIIYFFLIAIFSLYRINNPSQIGSISKTYYYFLFTSLFFIFINFYFIFVSLKNKINILIIYFSLFISISLIEIYLEIYKPYLPSQILTNERIKIAKEKNINFDKRSKYQVIQSMIDSGKKSYLKYEPYMTVEYDGNGLNYKNEKIFPLTGISNIYTTLSNETGTYPIILTDDYGFNNTVKLEKEMEYALIGDSFTEGYSVEQNENISAFMRKNKIEVYNFGIGGSGPLVHLGVFREYVQKVKPKKVIWLFYEGNDIFPDIYRESKSQFLMKYLNDSNFQQNLINNQAKINSALSIFIEKRTNDYFLLNNPYIRIIKLNNIRELLLSNIKKNYTNNVSLEQKTNGLKELEILKKILENVDKSISSWNGKFYFLYLPSYNSILSNEENIHKKEIFQFLKKLNIQFYDLENEIFNKYDDRISLFPFRLNGHYNKQAYKHIANFISSL